MTTKVESLPLTFIRRKKYFSNNGPQESAHNKVIHDENKSLMIARALRQWTRSSFTVTDGLCDQFLHINSPRRMINSSTSYVGDELQTSKSLQRNAFSSSCLLSM